MRLAPSAELRVVLFLQVRVLVIQRKQMDGPVRARGRGSHRCVKKEAQPNPCPPRAHSLLVGGGAKPTFVFVFSTICLAHRRVSRHFHNMSK